MFIGDGIRCAFVNYISNPLRDFDARRGITSKAFVREFDVVPPEVVAPIFSAV
jgi:hypothetical protein